MSLSDQQIDRYSRQILLPAVGGRGQQQLLSSSFLLRAKSPAACTAAKYLKAAGLCENPETPNLLLVDCAQLNETGTSSNAITLDLPLIAIGDSENSAWYSRATNTSTCPNCLLEEGKHVSAAGEKQSTSASFAVGAAAALEGVRTLLAWENGPPGIVFFNDGGVRRTISPLPVHCSHRRSDITAAETS